jgi:hypothetical protein
LTARIFWREVFQITPSTPGVFFPLFEVTRRIASSLAERE